MKPHLPMAAALAASLSLSVKAQPYTDDNNSLYIGANNDYYEEYINRNLAPDGYVALDDNASYTAKNINFNNSPASSNEYLLVGTNAKYIHITADEGTWSTIVSNEDNGTCVHLYNMSETSTIANTKLYRKGGQMFDNTGHVILVEQSHREGVDLVLDNVEIYLSTTPTTRKGSGMGIGAASNAVITNKGKGPVSITSDSSGGVYAALWAQSSGNIDLYNAHINVDKVYGGGGIIYTTQGTVSLTDSTITSTEGNRFIKATSIGDTVNLNNVNFDNAKRQVIDNDVGTLNLNLSNGTNFDGNVIGGRQIMMDMKSGSSWNVTGNSSMGWDSVAQGTLSLDGTSSLTFGCEKDDFYYIRGESIILESGAVINIDTRSYAGAEENIFDLLNFTDMSQIEDGVIVNLITGDPKYEWDYSKLFTDGTISVGLAALIPESTTATLGLLGLASLLIRRRRA